MRWTLTELNGDLAWCHPSEIHIQVRIPSSRLRYTSCIDFHNRVLHSPTNISLLQTEVFSRMTFRYVKLSKQDVRHSRVRTEIRKVLFTMNACYWNNQTPSLFCPHLKWISRSKRRIEKSCPNLSQMLNNGRSLARYLMFISLGRFLVKNDYSAELILRCSVVKVWARIHSYRFPHNPECSSGFSTKPWLLARGVRRLWI